MSFIELETKTIPLNMTTPSRKRKRETDKPTTAAALDPVVKTTTTTTIANKTETTCFTNAGFSSTPKKLIGKRRKATILANNNNINNIINNNNVLVKNAYLEVKPIEQIDQESSLNPYEVVRKPPKKKKRQTIEKACFENPALNLEIPDKQFNPYEVVRSEATLPTTPIKSQCFVNAALNIKGQDVSAARNPYEIQRALNNTVHTPPVKAGVANLALEEVTVAAAAAEPSGLKIGLPFKPNVGCRIDFQNMSLLQLTPSKLLAEKLVFSPVPPPKRSLDSISEESSKDISKELDRYQLELENSINEAKSRKNDHIMQEHDKIKQIVEQKFTFSQKLEGIAEAVEETDDKNEEAEEEDVEINVEQTTTTTTTTTTKIDKLSETFVVFKNNDDVAFASASEDEDEAGEDEAKDDGNFKAPPRFVRAYRRAECPRRANELSESKDSLTKSTENVEETKKHSNVSNLIRKSIRKLLHKNEPYTDFHYNNEAMPSNEELNGENKHNSLMTTIRHSLRRKPTKQPLISAYEDDMSIVDTSERNMKFKSNLMQNEYAKIEELTTEKKHTLRYSLRRTTRDFGQQLMKNVFHKEHETYDFIKQ